MVDDSDQQPSRLSILYPANSDSAAEEEISDIYEFRHNSFNSQAKIMILDSFESPYTRLPSCIFRAPKTGLNRFLVGLQYFHRPMDRRLDCGYGLDRS